MAYQSPTLTALITQIIADIDSRLEGAQSGVKNRVLNAIGYALGGAFAGEYEELHWLSQQIIPHLADDDFLLRWAAFFGVPRKQPAQATGSITATVADVVTIPEGTLWQRSDNVVYRSIQAVSSLAGGSLDVPATALISGAVGNAPAGTTLTLVSPLASVQPGATLGIAGMTGGANVEPIEQLRARLILRVQYPPQGGTKWDYERWAREVPGVANAWCYPEYGGAGLGGVGLAFILDGQGDAMFPTDGDVARVSDYVHYHPDPLTNQPVGKPLGPVLTMIKVIKKTINMTIKLTPNTPEVQAAVTTEINQLFADEGRPDGVIYISHIDQAISNAEGETDHKLIEPQASIITAENELAVPGVITWQ